MEVRWKKGEYRWRGRREKGKEQDGDERREKREKRDIRGRKEREIERKREGKNWKKREKKRERWREEEEEGEEEEWERKRERKRERGVMEAESLMICIPVMHFEIKTEDYETCKLGDQIKVWM